LAILALAAVLSVVSVFTIDRIERMSDGPVPADHNLLRVVFLSGWFVLGIFSWAIVAGHGSLCAAWSCCPRSWARSY